MYVCIYIYAYVYYEYYQYVNLSVRVPSMCHHHAHSNVLPHWMAPQKGTTIHHTPPGTICPPDGLKLIYRYGWFWGFKPGEVHICLDIDIYSIDIHIYISLSHVCCHLKSA